MGLSNWKNCSGIIFNRVDANKDSIGLTNFKGDMPTSEEVEIAKNYLTEDELCLF